LQGGPANKPYFCFHHSCGRTYGYGKSLENHVRSQHKGRLHLPGTCDHEGSIRRFNKWEDCLDHFIYHQNNGMSRKEYDSALAGAEYWIAHDDQQIESKKTLASPSLSVMSGSPVSYGAGPQQSDMPGYTNGSWWANDMPWGGL
jgi:hypothetical protein